MVNFALAAHDPELFPPAAWKTKLGKPSEGLQHTQVHDTVERDLEREAFNAELEIVAAQLEKVRIPGFHLSLSLLSFAKQTGLRHCYAGKSAEAEAYHLFCGSRAQGTVRFIGLRNGYQAQLAKPA